MLKRAFALSLTVFLTASLGTSAFAAVQSTDVEKTLAFIDDTNHRIEVKIENAVVNADQLETDYLQDINKLEEEALLGNLKELQQKLNDQLKKSTDPVSKALLTLQLNQVNAQIDAGTVIINEKIASLDKQLSKVSVVKINDAAAVTDKILTKLLKTESKYNERTQRYVNDLDTLINELDSTTRKMSDEAIQRGAENGLVVERYWTQVKLADRLVWIDPIRVVWR